MALARPRLLLLGVVVACASCASILGIEEPKPYRGSAGGGGANGGGASASSGGGQKGGGEQGGSGGAGGGGGAVVCPPDKQLCAGSDPPCVDLTSDPQHCGTCMMKCKSFEACSNSACSTPTALTTDYVHELTSTTGAYLASGLSLPKAGSVLAVGGTLSGNRPFEASTVSVMDPNPFVWLTQTSAPTTDLGFESICEAMNSCGSVMTSESAHDIVINAAGTSQLVGSFGIASFAENLGLLGVDPSLPGTGLGQSNDTGAQLAVGALDEVTVVALSGGQPAAPHSGWPLSFMPMNAVKVPVRIARVTGDVLIAGGIDGPGSVGLGSTSATVHGKREAFLAFYDNGGHRQWFTTFAGESGSMAAVVDVVSDGSNAYVVGTFKGSIDFVSSSCGKLQAPAGKTRMFAAALALSGEPDACNWATSFGGSGGVDTPVALTLLSDSNDVAIVGSSTSTSASFGGQALAVPAPLFLLVLDGGTGAPVYSWTWGNSPGNQATGQPVGVVSHAGGDLWIAGSFIGGPITDLALAPADVHQDSSYVVHFSGGQLPQ